MFYNVHQLMSTESNNLFTLCMFNRKYLIRKTTFYYLSSVTYDLLNIYNNCKEKLYSFRSVKVFGMKG